MCRLDKYRLGRESGAVSREADGGRGMAAQRPRDEPPGHPRLVSPQTQHPAGRVGSIELLGGHNFRTGLWADLPEVYEAVISASGEEPAIGRNGQGPTSARRGGNENGLEV